MSESDCKESVNAIKFSNNHLGFIGQDVHKIPSVLSKLYGNKVNTLDLSYNCLTSVQELSNFPCLKELILDNNQLNDSIVIPRNEKLHTLSLNKNNINDLDLLLSKIGSNLPNLRFLSLLGNKACPNQLSNPENDDDDYQRYRYYVLFCLPNLQFLDSRAVTDEEKLEAQKRGKFMKVHRPTEETNGNLKEYYYEELTPYKYTPLSAESRHAEDHRGVFGRCKYKYAGKHSEGNRFILNKDL